MKKKIVIDPIACKIADSVADCPYLSFSNPGEEDREGYYCKRELVPNNMKFHSLPSEIECRLEDEKSSARWFKKGRESVLRDNKSGCCCLFDEKDNLVSICNAHKEWVEDHK